VENSSSVVPRSKSIAPASINAFRQPSESTLRDDMVARTSMLPDARQVAPVFPTGSPLRSRDAVVMQSTFVYASHTCALNHDRGLLRFLTRIMLHRCS
jgi:hypothetical protein